MEVEIASFQGDEVCLNLPVPQSLGKHATGGNERILDAGAKQFLLWKGCPPLVELTPRDYALKWVNFNFESEISVYLDGTWIFTPDPTCPKLMSRHPP